MKKKKAINTLRNLLKEIDKKDVSVEDGYARRFRESIKLIFGQQSDFYDSAKEINFLSAHPSFNKQIESQDNSVSACGIARDLIKAGIIHVENFGIYELPKSNYFDGLSNWKIATTLGAIVTSSFIAGWAIGSVLNLFILFGYNQQPKNIKTNPTEQHNKK